MNIREAFVLFSLLILSQIGFGQYLPDAPTGFINDNANLLNSQEISKLNDKCFAFYSKHRIPIYVISMNSLGGMNVDEYGIEMYKKWKVGNPEIVNGIILTVAMDDRKIHFQMSPKNSIFFPDTTRERLIDESMRTPFRLKKYHEGFDKVISQLQYISAAIFQIKSVGNKTIKNPNPPKSKPKTVKPKVVKPKAVVKKPVEKKLSFKVPKKPDGYINDYAGMLSEMEVEVLDRKLKVADEMRSIPIYICTINTIEEAEFDDVSEAFYAAWKKVNSNIEKGAFLFIIKEKKKSFIYLAPSLRTKITSDELVEIIDVNLRPSFRDRKFFKGFDKSTSVLMQKMRDEVRGRPPVAVVVNPPKEDVQAKLEKERLEKERLEKERLEKERLEKERLEKERLEKERLEKERLEQERLEQERLAQEELEKERLRQEALAKEESAEEKKLRLAKELAERNRLEKEEMEKDRLEAERVLAEKKRLEKERLEREQKNKEREEARKNAEEENKRIEAERAEKRRLEIELFEKEMAEKEQADKERLAQEKLEREKMEKEKLALEKMAAEKAKQTSVKEDPSTFGLEDIVDEDTVKFVKPANFLELASISSTLNQGRVILEWEVLNNQNLIGFSAQRSLGRHNFEELGFIPSNKEGENPNLYVYVDENPIINGYYQIVQYDFSGKSLVSMPVMSKEHVCPALNFALLRDKKNDQYINFKSAKKTFSSILHIVDGEGKIKDIVNLDEENKANIVKININKLRKNQVYFLNIPGEKISQNNKFIKIAYDDRFE